MDPWTLFFLLGLLLLLLSLGAFALGVRKFLSIRPHRRKNTVVTGKMLWNDFKLFLKQQIPAISLASCGVILILVDILRLFVRWPIN